MLSNEYKIILSKRRSISLEVKDSGEVVVRAPLMTPQHKIKEMLEKHQNWITKVQTKVKLTQIKKHKFLDGELFYFLGEKYSLKIVKSIENTRKPLVLNNEFLLRENRQQDAKEIFTKWYRNEARTYVEDRANQYAQEFGFRYKNIKIKDTKTRWGSCSRLQNLNFSWRLVMSPPEIIDYVIVHELCHLKQMNHSKKFWREVETIIPNYKTRRKWLKANKGLFIL